MIKTFLRFGAPLVAFSVVVASLVMYQRQENQQIKADLLIQNTNLKIDQLHNTVLKAKTAEDQKILSQKQDELKNKQAQLDKLTADYSAKLKEIDSANKQITSLQGQIDTTSAQLQKLRDVKPLFTFQIDNPNLSNVDQKKADVEDVVTAAYDEIQSIYSKPYLLHQVVIDFVQNMTIPGAYAETEVSNGPNGLSLTIRIRDFDKTNFMDVNSIIHEIIHSFHGLALMNPHAYEEGETVAASDAVMANLISQGKIQNFSPLYVRISNDDYLNSSLTLPSDDTFYSGNDVAQYYQLAGYGWSAIYQADHNFFKTFNEKLYDKVRAGETVNATTIQQLIGQSTSATIHGKSINDWLQTKAFKLSGM